MKKIILALATIITLTPTAFAGGKEVDPAILSAFNRRFAGAQEVTWLTGKNYYKAIFTYNGARLFAYYNSVGGLLGLARYISSVQLPDPLQKSLKKEYPTYWITDLFELTVEEGTSYYISLENADSKIMLESITDHKWTTYQ